MNRKSKVVVAVFFTIVILAAFVSSLFLGLQLYSTKVSMTPSPTGSYKYQMVPLTGHTLWNSVNFTDPQNHTIAGFNFFGRMITGNGTSEELILAVKLSHANGTALRSLNLDLVEPADSCCDSFYLAPGGMSFFIGNYPQFQIDTVNKTDNVRLDINNFGPIGETQFQFGFGIKLVPNQTSVNNNGGFSIMIKANLVLYSTSSISIGPYVLYNGSSLLVGRTFAGNTSILATG